LLDPLFLAFIEATKEIVPKVVLLWGVDFALLVRRACL
jgi:hypothetical protein